LDNNKGEVKMLSAIKQHFIIIFLFAFVGLSAINAQAGIEDRPISTDDAYTLEKGVFTASIGSAFTKMDNGDREIGVNVDLGYGITERLEITVDFPTIFSQPVVGNSEQGLSDIAFRPEFILFKEQKYLPASSVAATIKTTSGDEDKGFGSGHNDYSLTLQFSKGFNPAALHFNVGYTFVGQSEEVEIDNVISYNLAFEYSFNGKLTLVSELTGETVSGFSDSDSSFDGLVGFVYEVKDNIALDFAGFAGSGDEIRLTSGLTYQF